MDIRGFLLLWQASGSNNRIWQLDEVFGRSALRGRRK